MESQTEPENRKRALKSLEEISQVFTEAMAKVEQGQEEFWNSLSQDQQLAALCAVARRIYKGDIEEKGTYRYVLYDVFGFGPEAYAPAQLAGYLAIHNAIMTPNEQRELLVRFAKHHNLGEEAVSEFYANYY